MNNTETIITSIPETITEDDANRIVMQYASGYNIQVQKKIYYPYFHVLFSYTVKTLFGRSRETKASCLVDLINNQASTTDKFEITEYRVQPENILEGDIDEEGALRTAKTYLTHASIHNSKVLFAPDSTILEKRFVYKAFWIVKCSNRNRETFKAIVDAVTGKFQVL